MSRYSDRTRTDRVDYRDQRGPPPNDRGPPGMSRYSGASERSRDERPRYGPGGGGGRYDDRYDDRRGGYGDRDGGDFRGGRGRGRGDGFRGGHGGGRGGGGSVPLAVKSGKFEVLTNHFVITPTTDTKVFRNRVEMVNLDDTSRTLKIEDKRILLEVFLKRIKQPQRLPYDGDFIVVSLQPIPQSTEKIHFAGSEWQVSISQQGAEAIALSSTGQRARALEDCAPQLVDIIFHHAIGSVALRFGRSRYAFENFEDNDFRPLQRMGPGLGVLIGHAQTVQALHHASLIRQLPTTGGNKDENSGSSSPRNPYQQLDNLVLTAAFAPAAILAIRPQKLAAYIKELWNDDLLRASGPLDTRRIAKMSAKLKNLLVSTFHVPQPGGGFRKTTYKMKEICATKTARNETFLWKQEDGSERSVTLAEYFKLRYSIQLSYPDAPVVLCNKKGSILPLELITVEMQKAPGMYSDEVKAQIADMMCLPPADRRKLIESKVNKMCSKNPVLREFGLEVKTEMMRWGAELLPPPILKYASPGQPNAQKVVCPEKGAWNMIGNAFIAPRSVDATTVVFWSRNSRYTQRDAAHMLEELRRQMDRVHMPSQRFVPNFTVAETKADLERIANEKPRLVIVLLPQREVTAYKLIKQTFDKQNIATQCLDMSKTPGFGKDAARGAGHFCNILMKVNEKLTGWNHEFEFTNDRTKLKQLMDGPSDLGFMLLGVAMVNPVSANIGNGKFAPSAVSMVASVNPAGTMYAHALRLQKRGQVTVSDFSEMLVDILDIRASKTPSNKWPRRIVYLRDGVSEGSMNEVVQQELLSIDQAYSQRQIKKPRVTAIIVIKSHPTRFFDPDQGSVANLPPGTCIAEDGVLNGPMPNFWLLSHAGIKGTSNPMRYFMLRDELGPRACEGKNVLRFWAEFIYQQCYLYQRCTRAVRTPATIYYAQQLATRAALLSNEQIMEKLRIGGAETMSIASGSHSVSIDSVTEEEALNLYADVNKSLRTFTNGVRPMFFC